MIALAVITDGRRHCIDKTIASALDALDGPITARIIYDDSGDPDNLEWLQQRFGTDGFLVIGHPGGRQGFGGAIRFLWQVLANLPEPFVFHLEDDFLFNRRVDLLGMAAVLSDNPNLVQLALRRQPWNEQEKAAGGIVEMHPGDWIDRSDFHGHEWLESRRNFTTNPSLYRTSLCARGWPNVEHSEGIFTHQLLEDPDVRFGYWGSRFSGEWVTHIGHQRVGVGY